MFFNHKSQTIKKLRSLPKKSYTTGGARNANKLPEQKVKVEDR